MHKLPNDFTFYTLKYERQYRATRIDVNHYQISDWKPSRCDDRNLWAAERVLECLDDNTWKIVDIFDSTNLDCNVEIESLL